MSRLGFSACVLALMASFLALGCLESNPQPMPQGKGDTGGATYGDATEAAMEVAAGDSVVAPDASADVAPESVAPEDAADAMGPADVVDALDGVGVDLDDAVDSGDAPDVESGVALPVECFHVPYMVPAGQPVPVAVFATSVSCAKFDHADVKVEGNAVDVQLIGKTMEGECPPCVFDTFGVIWLPPLLPGLHVVTVGDLPNSKGVIASGGDLTGPTCPGACAGPLKDEWELRWIGGIDGVEVTCGVGNVSSEFTFGEGCQDHPVAGADWTGPAEAYFCSQEQIFFGQEPMWETTASYCTHTLGAGDPDEHIILGLTVDYTDQPSAIPFLLLGH